MLLDIEADAAIVPLAHQRRRHQREDLCFKVRFRVLHGADAAKVLDQVQISAGDETSEPESGDETYAANLSMGGLGLCGHFKTLEGRTLSEGDFLKIEIQPPRLDQTVRCLGRVAWIELSPETGVFRAGVSFLAVNPEDLKKMRTVE